MEVPAQSTAARAMTSRGPGWPHHPIHSPIIPMPTPTVQTLGKMSRHQTVPVEESLWAPSLSPVREGTPEDLGCLGWELMAMDAPTPV